MVVYVATTWILATLSAILLQEKVIYKYISAVR